MKYIIVCHREKVDEGLKSSKPSSLPPLTTRPSTAPVSSTCIVELELDSDRPSKRSCGGRNNCTSSVEFDDTSIEPTEIEAAVRLHARKFVILCGLWLALSSKSAKAFFDIVLDDEYNPELRFSTDDDANEEHAQLRPDLPSCVPVEVIDGLNTLEHLLEDGPVHVQAQTMHSKLNIEYTAPGAIAGAAVFTLFLFSGDKDFGKVGNLTRINYYNCFGKYLEVILDSLRLRKLALEAEDEDEELSAACNQLLEMPSVPEIDLDEDDDL
ncbi:hypothetical protein B0H14DRAFT_3426366 [Mycena olivaceomarginata]|nr:hypothetical protein B0H14DRAFT_3426366 [Mycena olivaceomarginata]